MQLVFDQRYRRLVDFLSLDSVELEEPHISEKIMFLYDWAERKAKSNDLETIVGKLKSFKRSIGDTLRGKPLLVDLYKFARLDADKLNIQDEKKIVAQTEEERLQVEKKIERKTAESQKIWRQTKKQVSQEVQDKDLENISKTNYMARMIKSEDKAQARTNINYKVDPTIR